ncbi:hypothetical protein PSACC_00266 [Paramicrosporidium saccamoebae]|uniref:BHLH domain-containing protein n=1 Tax=Paramicrosporidium saccamoebae TaxID=1246581 RepID=A0A2H9TQ90_9FUNG|nr:hypothetical protein PSACC_00266 [Paramicrosporidium saccamoebae]
MGSRKEDWSSRPPFSVFGLDVQGVQMASDNMAGYTHSIDPQDYIVEECLGQSLPNGSDTMVFDAGSAYRIPKAQPEAPHSSAIPITGPSSKYVPASSSAGRVQMNNAMRFSMGNDAGSTYLAGPPAAPMPSPIGMSHTAGTLHDIMAPFHFYGHSQPTDETFSPQSPPLERAQMNSNKLGPLIAASPRSLNESMFSFRASSLTTVEQQMEKQRRRKENHNLVERRRRDLINIMIARLALLVSAHSGGLDTNAASKMNKGEILEASVRKILQVNQMVAEIAGQLSYIDPMNPVLVKYSDMLKTVITFLPEDSGDAKSPSMNGYESQ